MQRKNRNDSYAFVLWGEAFREIPATIFVGELRRAGVRVKVVGLNAQKATGLYGLKLIPDITLDEALHLAGRANCVIIPSDFEQLQQFSYDPRIDELLQRARANNAKIIIGGLPSMRELNPKISFYPQRGLIEFPDTSRLFEFAEQTAHSLARVG